MKRNCFLLHTTLVRTKYTCIYINGEQNVHFTIKQKQKSILWVIRGDTLYLQCWRYCTELLVVKNTVSGSFCHWPMCALQTGGCGRGLLLWAGPGASHYLEKSSFWSNTISSETLTSSAAPSSCTADRWWSPAVRERFKSAVKV